MAKEKGSKATEILGNTNKKHHRPTKVHVHKVGGGFHVVHEFPKPAQGEEAPSPEESEHVIPDMDALKQHMEDHMGEEPESQPQAQAPVPAAG